LSDVAWKQVEDFIEGFGTLGRALKAEYHFRRIGDKVQGYLSHKKQRPPRTLVTRYRGTSLIRNRPPLGP